MSDVVVTRRIAASPATVFSFFTDLERWTSWQGVGGELDPRPGGVIRIRMPGVHVASGSFVEIVPNERIVSTEVYEGAPEGGDGVVNTITFTELDGRTTLTILTDAPSRAVRDAIIDSGMESGMQEGMDLLEEVARSLR